MNPNEQLYTVGWSKIIFVQYFIVKIYKNSITKIIIYKYTCLIMF
jgi:hypothetical protein